MKRLIAIFLAFAIIFTLSACSAGGESITSTTEIVTVAEDSTTVTAQETEGKKILTVYFSSANTNSADVVSSATPDFDGLGSTEYLAQYIHGKVGGDIAKVTPVNDYPESYNATADAAKAERDADMRPEFMPLGVNPEEYDVIFIGYPMWWYTLPMIMYTFFDAYDLSGKTIIPFNTHEGSGDGGTYDEIRAFEPNATVLEGFNVRGSKADNAVADLDEWLESLDY